MRSRFTLILILALTIAACNSAGPAPTATPTAQGEGIQVSPTALSATPTATEIQPTPTEAPTDTPEPTATLAPQDFGPDNFPAGVNPLTGKPVSDPTLLDRRPLAVKIQTFPRSQRPPWGVSLADIVYDYYQNNGLTRLHTIFYGNDAEQVGPIRSARLLDSSLIRMYKSDFAFGSADQRILNRLFNSEYADRLILEGSNLCPVMCRVDPNGFNYLVTNTKEMGPYVVSKGVDNSRQNLNGMTFQHEAPDKGKPGSQLSVRYSISAYTRWDYDTASGRYLRFQDTQEDNTGQNEAYAPFMDRLTNEQIAADNVVVISVIHEYAYKSGNSEIVDILLSGSGPAYAFRDGQVYEVTWNRPAPDSVLFLTYPDGTPFPFKPGNTWFQVIGQSSTITNPQSDTWRFASSIP